MSEQDGWLLRARERNSIGAAESSDPRNGDGFSDAEGMAMDVEGGARRHSREVVWRPCCLAECDHNTVDFPGEARDPDAPDMRFLCLCCKREGRGRLHVM